MTDLFFVLCPLTKLIDIAIFFLFVGYIITLSVTQIILSRMESNSS